MSESSSKSSTRPNSAGNAAMIITNPDLVKKAKESLKRDKHININNSNNRPNRKKDSVEREKTKRQNGNNKSDPSKSNINHSGNKLLPKPTASNDDTDRKSNNFKKRTDGKLKGSSKTPLVDENSGSNENNKLNNPKLKGNSSSSQPSNLRLDTGVDLDLHRELFPTFYDGNAPNKNNNPSNSSSLPSKSKQTSGKRNGSSKTTCKDYIGNESRKDNQRFTNQNTKEINIPSSLSSNPQESYVSSSKDLSSKFAGSTFHSSPAPSALPQPSFKPPKLGDVSSPGVNLITNLLDGSNNTNVISENTLQSTINSSGSSSHLNTFNTLLAADRHERQSTSTSIVSTKDNPQNPSVVNQSQLNTNGNVSPSNTAAQHYYIQQQQLQQHQVLQNQQFASHHTHYPGLLHSQPQPHIHEYSNFQMNGMNPFAPHPSNVVRMNVGHVNHAPNNATTTGAQTSSNFATASPRMANYPPIPPAHIPGYFPPALNNIQSPMINNAQFGYPTHSPMMGPQGLIHGHTQSQYQLPIQSQDHLQQTYGHNQGLSNHGFPQSQDQSMADDLRRVLNISGPVAN